ncbi:MAG: hypothetical protein SNI70_11005 [Rikenellaceae bacterium]
MTAKNIKAQSFARCVRYVMTEDAEILKAEGVDGGADIDDIDDIENKQMARNDIYP